jgi:DNA polymerase-3 subunit delta'
MSASAEQPSALFRLSTALSPWLAEPLERLEAARRTGRLGHAWLIRGPAGIGKVNLALVFAHRLLEEIDPDTAVPPLDAEAAATAVRERHAPADHHPDLHWLFPEEAKRTIAVEQVRTVTEAMTLKGFRGRDKVVVVEPAEAMTVAAANALLKTLEEPTARTYLLLVSHQPDRLLPTIRSRCQNIVVPRPEIGEVAAWLGQEDAEARELLLLAGGAPFRALTLILSEKSLFLKELEEKMNLVSRNRLDAQSVADEWLKRDPELALEWLIRRVQRSIRQRMAPSYSNAVTDPAADPLHNAWLALTVEALFERLGAAEKLLDQLGSGVNAELAMRVLLLGFQPERGRT